MVPMLILMQQNSAGASTPAECMRVSEHRLGKQTASCRCVFFMNLVVSLGNKNVSICIRKGANLTTCELQLLTGLFVVLLLGFNGSVFGFCAVCCSFSLVQH